MDIIYQIQLGMTVEDGRVLKTPVGWLIGRDGVVKKDRYCSWSCSCIAFENVGLCSHTVAVAALENDRVKAIGDEFMKCWNALGTEAARLKAALDGKPG